MTEHPELLNEECKLDIKSSFVYSQEDIKRIVEGMIQSKFDNIQTSNNMEYGIESMQENISGDISKMLDKEVRTYSWTPKGVKINVYQRTERASTKGI